jgi:hypothetical protein
MAFCIRRSWSTKHTGGGKGERGTRVRESFLIPHFPCFPFPFIPIPLVFLDVVSVNPRPVFLLVASLKENIFTVLASHQVHACVNVLI